MIKLLRGKEEKKFSVEHAQNILSHPINDKVKEELKYTLPKDSDYQMKDGKLSKKSKK